MPSRYVWKAFTPEPKVAQSHCRLLTSQSNLKCISRILLLLEERFYFPSPLSPLSRHLYPRFLTVLPEIVSFQQHSPPTIHLPRAKCHCQPSVKYVSPDNLRSRILTSRRTFLCWCYRNTALTIGDGYSIQKAANQSAQTGFDNAELNLLYEFFENDKHEAIASIGLTWDIGGSGSQSIGNDSFSTWTPTFYFGKGFGDLPDSLPFLRPFAITGTLGLGIPTSSGTQSDPNPDTLEWGLALEYSLIYLQQHVKDVGLKAPFDRLIPLVEFAMSTPIESRGRHTNHRHHQSRGYLVRSILPGRDRSNDTGQQS